MADIIHEELDPKHHHVKIRNYCKFENNNKVYIKTNEMKMSYTTIVLLIMLKEAQKENDKKKIKNILKFIEIRCEKT